MLDSNNFFLISKTFYKNHKCFKHIKIFKKIHKLFIFFLKKNMFNEFKGIFEINIINNMFQNTLKHQYIHRGFFVELKLLDIQSSMFVFFSHVFINQILQLFFHNVKYIISFHENTSFSPSKIYIINKIIKIFIKSYNKIFKEWYFLDYTFHIYKNNMDVFLLEKYNLQLYYSTRFLSIHRSLKSYFIIYVPIQFCYKQDKYLRYLKFRKLQLLNSDYYSTLLNHTYNIELNLIVKLENNSILLSQFINFKNRDFFYIRQSKVITVYNDNNCIFLGKYYYNNNKIFFRVKENFLHTKTLKEEKNMHDIKNLENFPANYSKILQESKNDLLDSKKCSIKTDHVKNFDIKNNIILDTMINITIHLGTLKITIRDLLKIVPGKILYLDQFNQDQLDIFVNNVLIAQGELIHLEGKYGIRITKISNCIN